MVRRTWRLLIRVRRLRAILALLSLLLCLVSARLWVRSHRVTEDYWYSGGASWAVGLCPHRGEFVFYHVRSGPYSLSPGLSRAERRSRPFDLDFLKANGYALSALDVGGFGYVTAAGAAPGFRQRYYYLPAWALCLVTGIAPAAWAVGRVRRRLRSRRGLCPACGYDLRAAEGRCPECGQAASN